MVTEMKTRLSFDVQIRVFIGTSHVYESSWALTLQESISPW